VPDKPKSRGLCFTAPLVLALQNTARETWPPEPKNPAKACKGQTMRVDKRLNQPGVELRCPVRVPPDGWHFDSSATPHGEGLFIRCPHGRRGDYRYVQESCRVYAHEGRRGEFALVSIQYAADKSNRFSVRLTWAEAQMPSAHPRKGFLSGRYMPRWAARHWLRLVEDPVPVRVQSIDWMQAKWEGLTEKDFERERMVDEAGLALFMGGYEQLGPLAFRRQLWDPINARRGYPWDANPWVWRLRFVLCKEKPNVDAH